MSPNLQECCSVCWSQGASTEILSADKHIAHFQSQYMYAAFLYQPIWEKLQDILQFLYETYQQIASRQELQKTMR